MTYQLEEQYTSKNQVSGSAANSVWGLGARRVSSITIHHWGNKGQQFDTVRDFLCTNNTPTSAHYVAESGRVACIVSPDDCAFHAGVGEGNTNSIGIECRPEATDGDYATVAELIRTIRGIYGDIPLYPHNHWFNTACPGDYDLDRLDSLARGTIGAASGPTPKEDDMAISDDDAIKIANTLLRFQVDKDGGGKAMLLEVIASSNAVHDQQVKRILEGVAAIVKTSPGVDPAAIQAALDKAVAGLSITLTAKG